ncbi:MAG: hypothetical protein H6823_04565 [Planctomycetaceae bacterium]|nr:hypothetical protein [Planctomycetaceae bacterium]
MKRFIRQYSENITGVISCFDRVLFKGYLPDILENGDDGGTRVSPARIF